jgi:hypothetical protein
MASGYQQFLIKSANVSTRSGTQEVRVGKAARFSSNSITGLIDLLEYACGLG